MYLVPSQISMVELFAVKTSIMQVRLGSNYASEQINTLVSIPTPMSSFLVLHILCIFGFLFYFASFEERNLQFSYGPITESDCGANLHFLICNVLIDIVFPISLGIS